MVKSITEIQPNETFKVLGVEYRMVRNTGQVVDAPKMNNWGRRIGGTYKAHKMVVSVNRHHRGWSSPHYTVFPLNCSAVVE